MADQAPSGQESWDRIAHRAVQGPLARIIVGLEAVEHDTKSSLTPALKQTVHGSLVTARRLMDMFESLLVVEQINTGIATVGDTPVSLAIALEPVVKALEARAKAAEITFGWSAHEVALAVAGDEELLRRAVRLTGERVLDDVPKGGSLRVSAATDGRAVRLRITGSAQTDESAVFSITEPVEIGFARLAVERMGGKVTCVRTPDAGSMIDLLLPAPGAKPAMAAAAPAPAAAPPASAPMNPETAPVAATPVVVRAPAAPVPASVEGRAAAPGTGVSGSEIRLEVEPAAPPIRPVASSAEEKRESAAAPKLDGMTITAPWTSAAKKPEEAGAVHKHAVSSALPPGTESMKDVPADDTPEPPTKAGGLKITRHVDFDLMSQE